MRRHVPSTLSTRAPHRGLLSNVADAHLTVRAIVLVTLAASCASEPPLHPSLEEVVDAGAMPPPTSDLGRPPGVTPVGPKWREDLDLDGTADSDVSTGPCEAAVDRGTTCLRIRSTQFGTFEIPLHIDPRLRFGQVIEAGALGRFGGTLQRWYVYFTKYSTASQESESAAVYVFDLEGRNVVATTSTPEDFPGNWPSFGVYFSKIRAPGGQKLPFIAPGQSNILNQTQRFPASNTGISAPPAMKLAGKDVSPFSFLCIYSPNYAGSNPFCGTFKAVQVHARYSDPAIPADYGDYNYRVQLRMNGGFLLDVNHDGYEDIHLPFLGLLKTIDGAAAVAAPSASAWTDLPDATLVESYILSTPTNPTLISNNAGRLYATMRGLPDRDGVVLFAGQTTGSFTGYWGATCNSINFLLSYRAEAREGFRLKQRWAQRYRWANPVVKLDGSKQIESPGPGLDGCVHRYADGVASWGARRAVVFNQFSTTVKSYGLCDAFYGDGAANSACMEQNELPKTGTWWAVAVDVDTGEQLWQQPNVYVWGWSDRLLPGKTSFLFEHIDSSVRFDRAGHVPSPLAVATVDGEQWRELGLLPAAGYPEFRSPYPSITEGVTGNMLGINFVVEEDVDGDGTIELKLDSGQWIGFDAPSQKFVRRTPTP